MADDLHDDLKELDKKIDDVAKRLNIDIHLLRDISFEEIEYLIDHCPYLQIVDTVLHFENEDPPPVQLLESEKSGWTILDYGDAMSSSPGERILGLPKADEDEDEGGRGGSIRGQAYLTAMEMVAIAKAHGWQGIQIVDGHIIMKRAAWIAALDNGMSVAGFEPDDKDEAVRERVQMSEGDYEVLRNKMRHRK